MVVITIQRTIITIQTIKINVKALLDLKEKPSSLQKFYSGLRFPKVVAFPEILGRDIKWTNFFGEMSG
jgi:hypothetical protein